MYLEIFKKYKVSVLLSLIIFSIWVFKEYVGIIHAEYSVYSIHLFNKYDFISDPFINDGDVPAALIVSKILKFLKIDPNNDLIFFPTNLFLHYIYLFFFFKIIFEFVNKKFEKSLIILISLITIAGTISTSPASIIINTSPGSFTYFAHFFFPIFIYSIFKKNFFFIILSSSLMFFLSPRVGWMPILTAFIYSFFLREKKIKLWIIFPLLIAFYYYLTSNADGIISTYEEKITLIKDHHFFRGKQEETFTLFDKKSIFIQILSFFFYPFFLKKVKKEFKLYASIVFILSLLTYIFDWVYSSFFFEILPIPQIYIFSPPRSFFVYELFFYILLINYIFSLPIKVYFQVLIISFFFFAKLSLLGFLYSFVAVLSLFLVIFFFDKSYFFYNKNLFLLFFLIILPGSLYITSKKIVNFDYYSYYKINKWTTNSLDPLDVNLNFSKTENKKLLDFLISLRECSDFVLFDPLRLNLVNNIAYKSRIQTELRWSMFGKNKSINKTRLYKELFLLENNLRDTFRNSEKLNTKYLKKLEELKVAIIISQDNKSIELKNYQVHAIDNKNLLVFFGLNSNLKKYCNI